MANAVKDMTKEKIQIEDLIYLNRLYEIDGVNVYRAIEKAKPKTPRIDEDKKHLYCPNCGKPYTFRNPMEFTHGERFCNACGQYMKWEAENNNNREEH